jgi:hypothetical protein
MPSGARPASARAPCRRRAGRDPVPGWAIALLCLGCLAAGAGIAYIALILYFAKGFRW